MRCPLWLTAVAADERAPAGYRFRRRSLAMEMCPCPRKLHGNAGGSSRGHHKHDVPNGSRGLGTLARDA